MKDANPKEMKDKQDKREIKKPQASPAEHVQAAAGEKEIRGIVRIAGKDLKGQIPLRRAIPAVRGVGANLGQLLAGVVTRELGVPSDAMIGELSEEQLKRLEEIISSAGSYGVPSFMLNRQNDPQSGTTRHMIGTDLTFAVRQDIEHEKNIYTWRGYRHAYGQKVRGQHTRSTGRTGMTVGVIRKAILAKAGATAATGAAAQAAGAVPAAAPAAGGKVPAAGGKAPAGAAPKAAAPAAKAAAPAAAAKKEAPKK